MTSENVVESTKSDLDLTKPKKQKARVVFEGGGAKGLAHVGALNAIEKRNIEFVGIAGTSAGAIIAALVAVGYNSKELFDPNDKELSGVFDKNFISLIGRANWIGLVIAEKFIKVIRRFKYWLLLLVAILVSIYKFWSKSFGFLEWSIPIWALIVMIVIVIVIALVVDNSFYFFGIFSTKKVEKWIEQLLTIKHFPNEPNRKVKFADIPTPLSIIATDLRTRSIVNFNKQTFPNCSVAKAVAASISIPGAFRPVLYRGMVLVDGGMLSNFPAWVFDEEIEENIEIIPTFGFRLNPKKPRQKYKRSLVNYVESLIKTAFLGDNILEARQVLDLSQIPIKVTVNTLDFSISRKKKIRLYKEGKVCAELFYKKEYIGPKCSDPINEVFVFLEKEIREYIKENTGNSDIHLRTNLALPVEPNCKKLRILYSHNMKEDYDDQIVLGINQGAIGKCWQKNEVVLVDMDEAEETFDTIWKMNKYQQRLVRTELKTLVSIPVYKPNLDIHKTKGQDEIIAVLSIDSDDNLLNEFSPLAENNSDSGIYKLVEQATVDIAKILRR